MVTEYIKSLKRDKKRKPYLVIAKEAILELVRWRVLPIHYFTRFAYRKGINRMDYIPNQLFRKFLIRANDFNYDYLLNDKYVFNTLMESKNVPIVKTLATCHNGFFMTNIGVGALYKPENAKELSEFFSQFEGFENLFIKKANGRWGVGAFTLTSINKDHEVGTNDFEKYFLILKEDYWVIQEKVDQHKILAEINRSSLNTIRIDSFLTEEGEVEIFSALLRFGRSGSIVDNASLGGGFVGINENGSLKKWGRTYLKSGGELFDKHPDSGVCFSDVTLPFWNEVRDLVRKAAICFPQFRAVGWDIAITPSGPILIEANGNYQMGMSDVAADGYGRDIKFMRHFKATLRN